VIARLGLIGALAVWLFPAALAVELAGCNDGSTGCCMICSECACGNSCVSCSVKCTSPKGCACSSIPTPERAPLTYTPGDDAGAD
jgi:hypothetical protein